MSLIKFKSLSEEKKQLVLMRSFIKGCGFLPEFKLIEKGIAWKQEKPDRKPLGLLTCTLTSLLYDLPQPLPCVKEFLQFLGESCVNEFLQFYIIGYNEVHPKSNYFEPKVIEASLEGWDENSPTLIAHRLKYTNTNYVTYTKGINPEIFFGQKEKLKTLLKERVREVIYEENLSFDHLQMACAQIQQDLFPSTKKTS